MTKDEILKLTNPDDIWDAMQENKDLRQDPDLWRRISKLTFEIRKQHCIDLFGYYDPDICIDPIPRSDLKK